MYVPSMAPNTPGQHYQSGSESKSTHLVTRFGYRAPRLSVCARG